MSWILRTIRFWWRRWHSLPVWSWVRGAELYRQGRFQEAASAYQRGFLASVGHPAERFARLDYAYCLYKIGDLDQAEQELRLTSVLCPSEPEAIVRLAELQRWRGRPLEAAWTLRRAVRHLVVTTDLRALYLLAVIEAGFPSYLVRDAKLVDSAACDVKVADLSADQLEPIEPGEIDQRGSWFQDGHVPVPSERARERSSILRLFSARARLRMEEGERDAGRAELVTCAHRVRAPFESMLMLGEVLLQEGKVAEARNELQRAMIAAPQHPRLLALIAVSYLKSGPDYSPAYAVQLAERATQLSNWSSPRELRVLAEAYYHLDDRVGALMVAHSARELSGQVHGSPQEVRGLDELIESISNSGIDPASS